MAIRSGFFNSVNQDRRYNAYNFAEYFASFIGNGVFPNPSNGLQVIANDDMTVTVKAGKAWINGYILINDDDYILELDPADGVLNRIDRTVLRYDVVDREIRIEVKQGTFAGSPVAPVLQRDTDAYELCLAEISVNAGTINIASVNITDLRNNNEFCGKVDSLIAGDINSLVADFELHKESNVHIPTGLISMWSGSIPSIPNGWSLCDGTNGTPDLRDRFIMGATSDDDVGETGGQNEVTLTVDQIPSHQHTISSSGSHSHSLAMSYSSSASSIPVKFLGTESTTDRGNLSASSAGAHTHTIGSTGSGESFDNRPTYYKLAFIMKV